MTFEEVKKDYLKIIAELGFPHDMTGGFVDAERMEKVIRNPLFYFWRNTIILGLIFLKKT